MKANTIVRINHVHLRVRNLRTSTAFYCTLFDLQAGPTEPPSGLSQQCLAAHGHPEDRFGFVLTQGLGSGIEPSGLDHVSLEVGTLNDVVTLYRKARSMNLRVTEPRVYDGRWQFFVFDPDGYKIEVMAAQLPGGQDSGAVHLDITDFLNRRSCHG